MRALLVVAAVASNLLISPISATAPAAERYTANALNIGGDAGPVATLVQIDIERWSTDEEHDRLADPLATNRQSDAATILRNMPRVGALRTLELTGEPIYYARKVTAKDKTESILLIAVRPMRSFELAMKPNMSAYPFTVIQLNVDATGKGLGRIDLAATLNGAREKPITAVPDKFVDPVRLTSVKRSKS